MNRSEAERRARELRRASYVLIAEALLQAHRETVEQCLKESEYYAANSGTARNISKAIRALIEE